MAFRKLLTGFKNFHADHFAGESEVFKDLVEKGQAPETLFIACSDSRVDPAILTQAEPGDIFSVRNVAAMVPPMGASGDSSYSGTSAAIEYAVIALKVKHIVVLGHALCGGVRALAEADPAALAEQNSFVAQWISAGLMTREKVMTTLSGDDFEMQVRALEQAIILQSLNNLLSYPFVREAVLSGDLHLHGWYFDMPNGKLLTYDPRTTTFEDILHGEGTPSITQKMCGCDKIDVSLLDFLAEVKKLDIVDKLAQSEEKARQSA